MRQGRGKTPQQLRKSPVADVAMILSTGARHEKPATPGSGIAGDEKS